MPVTTTQRGAVLVITLDRTEKRNAMDASMTEGLDAALNSFEDDPALRCAVLTGGPTVFSAGTDIANWAGEPTERGGPYGIAARELRKPVIAAVEGVAAGGGMEIVLSTTMVVASETATFSLPEVTLGLVAECGGMFRAIAALPRNVGAELLLTAERLPAARAHEFGFVNRLVAPGEALAAALELAQVVASRAPLAIEETMRVIDAVNRRHDADDWAATEVAKTRARESQDAHEGVDAFLSRRPAEWSGR